MPHFRILLVEDFEPFRRFVRLALQARSDFKVVGEAVDGLEAVQKAKQLQPDLILMDIGLPKLNGIAAAEQIRILAPHAKVLFISLESSPTAVREAFHVGGYGYIHKMRAESDLLPAIEAALAGKQFVSSDLEFSVGTKARCRHEVQFYSDDMLVVESAAAFIAGALKADGAAIVLAAPSHQEGVLQKLNADGFDMEGAIRQGTYILLNAVELVSNIMVNGVPDTDRLSEILGGVIESSLVARKTAHSPLVLVGECAGILWAGGKTDASIRMEKKCNDLLETQTIDILCPYPLSGFQPMDDERGFQNICAEHTAVFSG